MTTRRPWMSARLPVLAVTMLLLLPSTALALCAAHAIEGRWVNNSIGAVMTGVTIEFKCCDSVANGQLVCDPPADVVRATMPCAATGTCTYSASPHYSFVDEVLGNHETRLDVRWVGTTETREMVLLLLPDERLLVHWSVKYAAASQGQDFSVVEYFVRPRCFTYLGREYCLGAPKFAPRVPTLPPPQAAP